MRDRRFVGGMLAGLGLGLILGAMAERFIFPHDKWLPSVLAMCAGTLALVGQRIALSQKPPSLLRGQPHPISPTGRFMWTRKR